MGRRCPLRLHPILCYPRSQLSNHLPSVRRSPLSRPDLVFLSKHQCELQQRYSESDMQYKWSCVHLYRTVRSTSRSTSYPSTSGSRQGTMGDIQGPPGATNTRLVLTLLAVSFTFLVATLPRSAVLIVAAFIQHLVHKPYRPQAM